MINRILFVCVAAVWTAAAVRERSTNQIVQRIPRDVRKTEVAGGRAAWAAAESASNAGSVLVIVWNTVFRSGSFILRRAPEPWTRPGPSAGCGWHRV